MSIPASIAISKLRVPELEVPVTMGRVVVDRGKEDERHRPANVLHAYSKGATFGLIVAGQILYVPPPLPLPLLSLAPRTKDECVDRPCPRVCHKRSPHLDWTRLWYHSSHTSTHPLIRLLPCHVLHGRSKGRDLESKSAIGDKVCRE